MDAGYKKNKKKTMPKIPNKITDFEPKYLYYVLCKQALLDWGQDSTKKQGHTAEKN